LKSSIEQSRRIYDDTERIVHALEEATDRRARKAPLFEAEELPERLEVDQLRTGEL
jgi:hypothetical protein